MKNENNSTRWWFVVMLLAIVVVVVWSVALVHRPDSNTASEARPQMSASHAGATSIPTEPKPNPLSAQQKRELGKAESQGKKEREKEEEQARIAAAKFFENKLLAAGYSADVFINGPRHTYLTLRYIQFTKAFQYQFEQQEQDTLRSWRDLGLTKITMTDGYDTNSVWNLKR